VLEVYFEVYRERDERVNVLSIVCECSRRCAGHAPPPDRQRNGFWQCWSRGHASAVVHGSRSHPRNVSNPRNVGVSSLDRNPLQTVDFMASAAAVSGDSREKRASTTVGNRMTTDTTSLSATLRLVRPTERCMDMRCHVTWLKGSRVHALRWHRVLELLRLAHHKFAHTAWWLRVSSEDEELLTNAIFPACACGSRAFGAWLAGE
jgi:hypothetical protein